MTALPLRSLPNWNKRWSLLFWFSLRHVSLFLHSRDKNTSAHFLFFFFFKLLNQLPFAGREGGGGVHWHEHIDPKDPLLLFPPRKKKKKTIWHASSSTFKIYFMFFLARVFAFIFFSSSSIKWIPPPHPLGYLSINIDQHCVVHSLMEGEGHLKNSCFLVSCVQPKLIWNLIIFNLFIYLFFPHE